MSSYAAHGRDAEWRAARSTATTLELKASYRCCRWPVRESCRETWEPPSPFHSRDPTKFVRSAVAVRRSFLSFTVSLHLSLSHVENLREIAVDARAITCPPYFVRSSTKTIVFTGILYEFWVRVFLAMSVSDMWVVFSSFFPSDIVHPSRREGRSDKPN